MDGTAGIITGRERRRRWSTSEKLRIVAETYDQGATVGDVALFPVDVLNSREVGSSCPDAA